MRKTYLLFALATMGLTACVTPPPAGKISNTAVAQNTLSVAEQAVEICGRTFPNLNSAAVALMNTGFA
ncbi:MAG: hypothetical protein ABJD13_07735 [Paracoccaceae bacterium]